MLLSKLTLAFCLLLSPFLLLASNDNSTLILEMKAPSKYGKTPKLSVINDTLLLSWTELEGSQSKLNFATFFNNKWSAVKTAATGINWFINYADYAKVTPITSQHFVASWLVFYGDSNFNYRFMLSQSFDAGQTWSRPMTPIKNTQGEHGFISVIKSANKALLTWISAHKDIFTVNTAQLDGQNLFSEVKVIDTSSCSCCHTDMALYNNKPLLVYRDRTSHEIRDIAFSQFEDASWSKPRIIQHDHWQINGCPVNGPAISSTLSGYAIAWFSAPKNKASINLLAINSNDESLSFTLEASSSLGYVDMAPIDDNVIISWLSNENDVIQLKLQTLNIRNLSLGTAISIKRNDFSGFPSITSASGHTYITYATPSGDLILLKAVF